MTVVTVVTGPRARVGTGLGITPQMINGIIKIFGPGTEVIEGYDPREEK